MKASNLRAPRTLAACQFTNDRGLPASPARPRRGRGMLALLRALLAPFAPAPADLVWHSAVGSRVRFNGHPHLVTGAQRVADNASLLRFRLLPLGQQIEVWTEPRAALEQA